MNRFQQAARQMGLAGTAVGPYRVGGTTVQRGVGAPAILSPAGVGAPPVMYSPQEFASGGNSYMGFGTTVIPANTNNVPVQVNPIRPFTPMEMRCPSTVIGLQVDQMTIQGVQFFANRPGFGIPIEMFSEVSRLQGLEAATIQPDTGVEFFLSNPTGGDLVFSGCFRGTQVRI